MIVGFKAGPRNWDEAKSLVGEGARFCELWFDVTKADSYQEMLDWFGAQKVQMGLHHWGLGPESTKTNLMTEDVALREETMRQIKETIDIGARIACAYVNVHPGAEAIERLDFEKWQQSLKEDAPRASRETATRLLLEAVQELLIYAESRGVLLTVETLPARESESMGTRSSDIYDPGNTDLDQMRQLARGGAWIANDITHTAGHAAVSTQDRAAMWEQVYTFSQDVADRTRLIHVNTVSEPFDGSDSHNGILPDDFANGVWPSREELLTWLGLYAHRDDVYAVPEPRADMSENYRELARLAAEAVERA